MASGIIEALTQRWESRHEQSAASVLAKLMGTIRRRGKEELETCRSENDATEAVIPEHELESEGVQEPSV
ncbi:hypothetical protein QM996_30890 (plasmid) [Sinorhizobium chiapasense]|uniref:hypothetical protein n=1 Tax=Sinorhizobium chiapasense TaxID=501572 RepID=UPI002FE005C2